jgi:hypothetical protein
MNPVILGVFSAKFAAAAAGALLWVVLFLLTKVALLAQNRPRRPVLARVVIPARSRRPMPNQSIRLTHAPSRAPPGCGRSCPGSES